MQQSPSWEADSRPTIQGIPCLLWKPQLHHRVQKIPPLVAIQSQMNLDYILTLCIFKTYFNIILPSTSTSSRDLFPSSSLTTLLHVLLIATIPATCPALSSFDLITLTIFREEYQLWTFSFCGFLQIPVTVRSKFSSQRPFIMDPQCMFFL